MRKVSGAFEETNYDKDPKDGVKESPEAVSREKEVRLAGKRK